MRPKVKLLYLFTVAFVIVAVGIMALNRMDGDIAVLEDTARETRLRQLELDGKQSEMKKELAMKDQDSYIRDKARTIYGYLAQGEILFVVDNPEALYENGEIPQAEPTEDTEG